MPRSARIAPSARVAPDNPDLTIGAFCRGRDMSKAAFYRLPQKVRDELVTYYGPKTARILPKAAAKFDRDRAKPNSTEQRLIARMRARRVAQTQRAAAAAVASPHHVSNRLRRS